MRQVQSTEAKARLAELLRLVEGGERISITRHGRPVAHLVPAHDDARVSRREAMGRLMEARSRWEPAGMSREEILAARHEGHRL